MTITGTQFGQIFLKTPYRAGDGYSPERESLIVQAFADGNVPDFILKNEWLQIVNHALIDGTVRSVRLWISPFLALGTDGDPLYTAMTPQSAQAIATQLHSHILSSKLVRDYFNQATLKIPIQVPGTPLKIPGPDMNKPEAILAHNALILKASSHTNPATTRIAGHSKNVVIGPGLKNGVLAIYGGYTGVPGKGVDGWCYQSYPGPHPSDWVDYSQLVQLVFGKCELDGVLTDTSSVFLDPKLCQLVTDIKDKAGRIIPYNPVYPNTVGGAGPTPISTTPPKPKPPVGPPPTSHSGDGTGGPVVTLAVAAVGALLMIKALTK